MPTRETQIANPALSHAQAKFTISSALMPSLVQERSRRRDALLKAGAEDVVIYRDTNAGPGAASAAAWAGTAAALAGGNSTTIDSTGGEAILRAKHCIVRTMAEHFIVPLSSVDGPTDSELTIVRNYEVIDVINELHKAIELSENLLNHRLPLPPRLPSDPMQVDEGNSQGNADKNESEANDESLEATTLDIWLAPRLLSAMAMLTARCAELQVQAQSDGSKTPEGVEDALARLTGLQARMSDLLHMLLRNSALSHGSAHVRFMLDDFLRVAEYAILLTSPNPGRKETSDSITFFAGSPSVDHKVRIRELPARSKIPMNEAWLPEDQSPFSVTLIPSISSSKGNPTKRSFFYAHALLVHIALAAQDLDASYPQYVTNAADRIFDKLQGEWHQDLLAWTSQLPRRPLPIAFDLLRTNLVRGVIEQADRRSTNPISHHSMLRLLNAFTQTFIRDVLTDMPQPPSVEPVLASSLATYFRELRRSMRCLRRVITGQHDTSRELASVNIREAARSIIPSLRRCLAAFIEVASEGWELNIVEASAMHLRAEDKVNKSFEMIHKNCAFEAVMLVVDNTGLLHAHAISGEVEALQKLCGDDVNATALQQAADASISQVLPDTLMQDVDEHAWLSREDRVELISALNRYRKKKAKIPSRSATTAPAPHPEAPHATPTGLKRAFDQSESEQSHSNKRGTGTNSIRRSQMRTIKLQQLEDIWDREVAQVMSHGPEQLVKAVELVGMAFCAASSLLGAKLEKPSETLLVRHLQCSDCDSLNYTMADTAEASIDSGSDIIRRCCSKAGYTTVLRLLENVASTLPLNEKAAPLLDGVRRCFSHAGESLLLDHALRPTRTIIQKGLRHPTEAGRAAAVRLCAVVVHQACASQVISLRSEIMDAIDHIVKTALTPLPEPHLKVASLLLACELSKTENMSVQQRGLSALTLTLDDPTIIGDLAADFLLQVQSYHSKSIFKLLKPYMSAFLPHLIAKHAKDGKALAALLHLIDQPLDIFIRSTIEDTMPVLVADANLAAVDLIARTLKVPRAKLCLDTMAPYIMPHILSRPAAQRDQALNAFIKMATDGANGMAPPLDGLLRGTLTEVLGHLLLELGDEKTKANARDSLQFVERNLRKSNSRPVNQAKALSDMIASEILPLQYWLSGQLLGTYGKRSMLQRARVLRGIGALVEVAGSAVNAIRPQIMTALTSGLSEAELRLDALRAWNQFFTKLPFEDIAPVVGQTAAVVLDWWAHFSSSEKEVATQLLRYAILLHGEDLGDFIDAIPSLDALETEIPDIARKLRGHRIRQANEEVLEHILERVSSDNASVSYHSLLDLLSFLTGNHAWIESLTSGNRFGAPISGIVTTILSAASRIEDERNGAKIVCLQCLGILGAIDPDRFEHSNDEQSRTILKDFEDKDEAAEFGVYVIQHVLVSAFRHAIDATAQSSYAYSIQEMLKYCGLTRSSDYGDPPSVVGNERWKAFPTSIMDTLNPLASSRYKWHAEQREEVPSPLYKNMSSYRKWLVQWALQLTSQVAKPGAKSFFGIVGAAVSDHDILVARFILPHLVLHILISGPDERRSEIRSELVAILNDQVDDSSQVDEDRRQQSAQIVFQLLDHLNVFIRRKRLETIHRNTRKVRHPEVSEALVNVESILVSIPEELMARASLRCKSYARALLSFESRVRIMKTEAGKADGDIQEYYANMHEIYANVDEPDGMQGVSTRILNPTLEHQIREHEMTGRWTSAQSCWEVKLQQEPESLDSQMGLLRCLRSLGHFDNLRTHIRGILTKHPEWRHALAAFTLESAWSLGEWDDVADAVQDVEEPLPEHGIGKAFLCMREDNVAGFKSAVQEARDVVGKPIFSAGSGGYPQIVDSITQLHMLHELEMIQAVPKDARPGSGQVTDLLSSLRSRLQSSVPSFRTREALLSLRRSAFGVRSDAPDLIAEVGRCWTTTSKIARKAGHTQTAYSAVLQAIREKAPFAFVQNAKLLASNGEVQHALREVETTLQSKVFRLPGVDADTAGGTAANAIDLTDSPRAAGGTTEHSKLSAVDVAKACLLRARLMELAGRFESNDVIARYKQSSKVDPKAEKSWYFLGRYYDSLRDTLISKPILHKGLVVRFFLKAAMSGTKFFYRTMPRIATIWLDAGEDAALVKASKLGRPIEKSSNNMEAYQNQEIFEQMNDRIRKLYSKVPAYQWYGIFPQLVSRVIHKNEIVWQVLQELIAFVVKAFPEQAMWSMVAGVQSKDEDRARRMTRILAKVKADAKRDANDTVESIVDRSRGIAEQLLVLCELNIKNATSLSLANNIPLLGDRNFRNLLIPLQDSIVVNLPTDFSSRADHQGFPSESPRIRAFDDRIEIMASLQKPRKIGIKGTDGRLYNFLCKPKDDLRKDARLMEFDSMINKFLQSNAESRRRRLHIRTYAVVTLNEECGFIEWVPNTIGFRNILTTLYASKGVNLYTPDVKPYLDEARLSPDSRRSVEIFEGRLLVKYPPVFHEWFLATFSEPSAWMKARLSYGRTAAVMSMVGWVLGLGDRHGENILFDATNGDTVHVDFNCLFEKGQTFEIPEKVPFRLTQNMVDALGVTGVEGVYRRACEITMSILRENKDSLMSVLDAMIHDPLVDFGNADDGRKRRNGSTTANADRLDPRVVAARQNLAPIERKLEGFMVSKLDTRPMAPSTTGGRGFVSGTASSAASDGMNSGVMGTTGRYGSVASKGATAGHPTNELVDMLIREATSSLLLTKMYVGWAPYL
ncbi:unnamed protein product [Tilletia laevis]|uniref:non-specific serine/threonine protein kinase n=2 Tax=Tilletia TaxID=13289 RepID=A0A177UHD8_9BASI|nr:hypothetical protein CF336_g2890 [Tilletia laevis]KAE8262753.1 hypothetical protein A4X03_0g2207 [Tilletia caries]KAE8205902.1 hypothetical protein CF335_g2149 [Tilletia laevis]CAD6885848.1 unnamed protein product [Tilletia caries]CAD6935965.1 unnamed protein product [Tilletia caries]